MTIDFFRFIIILYCTCELHMIGCSALERRACHAWTRRRERVGAIIRFFFFNDNEKTDLKRTIRGARREKESSPVEICFKRRLRVVLLPLDRTVVVAFFPARLCGAVLATAMGRRRSRDTLGRQGSNVVQSVWTG